MKTGVQSNNQITGIDPNAIIGKAKLGVSGVIPFVFYRQSLGATGAITTEASIFTDASATPDSSRVISAGALADSALVMDALKAGGIIKLESYGTIANASTPALTVKVGLSTLAGSFTDYSGSGSITLATTGAVLNYKLEAFIWVDTWSATAGYLNVIGQVNTFSTDNKTAQSIQLPLTRTGSFDSTAARIVECKVTCGIAFTPALNLISII
jgi:hypothetical protein